MKTRNAALASDPTDLGRRKALKLSGLTIAFLWAASNGTARAAINARRQPGDAAAAAADGNPPFAPNAFIRIDADGTRYDGDWRGLHDGRGGGTDVRQRDAFAQPGRLRGRSLAVIPAGSIGEPVNHRLVFAYAV